MKKNLRRCVSMLVAMVAVSPVSFAQPRVLTTLEYHVTGSELRVSPVALSAPKGIAGSISVELTGADAASPFRSNTVIEATLRGPSGPPQRIIGTLGQPLLLPPLALVGEYHLDGIRLARAQGADLVTVMEGSPPSVPVHVFDQVLVSRVTSRPLTSSEIQEKGIFIDESNFRAVEFEVGFALDGKTIPVKFPVISPQFKQNTEIVPTAELEAKLATAAAINQNIGSTLQLPPELEAAGLNIQVQAINFQQVDAGDADLNLKIPPIPALLVIPGNIGFLNQFFSVQLFTENAAPKDSGLSVVNVRAEMVLPPGPDQIPATDFDHPGDDPLRFARTGPDKQIHPNLPVTRAGPDGQFGTADDILRLNAGETGQAEFLVEGLQEGLHTMNVKLTADLEGLAAGKVKITGGAAGSVLVRNPNFSLAFSHPRTVRSGEPYEASVTVLNTSITPANRVQITLPKTALSGAAFEGDQQSTVEIGDLAPGQSGTARFHLRSQRTGEIKFSNITTSDDASHGSFNLTMSVDERGVALSPDTILLPDFVNNLPTGIRTAADRVLGQALSIATAGKLPPNVLGVPKSLITRRALDLAEAGQRLLYGDGTNRVLVDLLLDWQGGREFQEGWDQILRETDAGREWREALRAEFESNAPEAIGSALGDLGPDIAGRGEQWLFGSFERAKGEVTFETGGNSVSSSRSAIPGALIYGGATSGWLVVRQPPSDGAIHWRIMEDAAAHLNVLQVETNGTGVRFDWTLAPKQGCFVWNLNPGGATLAADSDCDGTFETSLSGNLTAFAELPPSLISVRQDLSVLVGRPDKPCELFGIANYANVVAALFSKPMLAAAVSQAAAYSVDGDNGAAFVQIQPGGRVALLTLRKPIGGLIPRTLTVDPVVTDPHGHALSAGTQPVLADFRDGVSVAGRVVRADGTPAANIPATLTYLDHVQTADACNDWTRRVAQVQTDANGRFSFDFVLSGLPFVVSATDTSGLTSEEIGVLLDSTVAGVVSADRLAQALQASNGSGLFDVNTSTAVAKAEGVDRAAFNDLVDPASRRSGTQLPVVLTFRGRAKVTGQVLASDGTTPVASAAVNLFPDPDSRELGRGVLSGSDGRFSFFGVPLGVFSIEVAAPSGAGRIVSDAVSQPGETRDVRVILSASRIERGSLAGRVLENDNVTPHPGATLFVKVQDTAIRSTTADASGFWRVDGLQSGVYNLIAFSQDSRRAGLRNNVAVAADATNAVDVILNGTATVRGRVLTAAGDRPVSNALIAGGDVLVRTDGDGIFTATGVPTGHRTISAGVERTEEGFPANSDPAFDFPRFGSASLDVVPGDDNFVIIQLKPAASIHGRVLDANGAPVPGAKICQPQDEGFFFISADALGNFVWENLPVGKALQFSAPGEAPPVNDTSVPSGEAVQNDPEAALTSALGVLLGVNDPLLNGAGANFNPGTFDAKALTLDFDGESREIIFRLRPKGRISGIVLNGQNSPIGAAVRVTGEGLSPTMAPTIVVRGNANSDPETGAFAFDGVAVGNIQLQGASPFFPTVISTALNTTSTEPDATNVVLRFPKAREVEGRLAGKVFQPDGFNPAGGGIKVGISFGDLVIETDTNSVFDTHFGLPAPATYTVTVTNISNGLVGQAIVDVSPTGTNNVQNFVNVRLLGKGALKIQVIDFKGAPVSGALVKATSGSFPHDSGEGTTDANGSIGIEGLSEGVYAVQAEFSGAAKIFGRSSATVVRDVVNDVVIALEPTATLTGRFVLRDGVTPVAFAQIAIRSIGFATSDELGHFEFSGVPLGTQRLFSNDPVTGRAGKLDVTLSTPGEVRDVLLVEQSLGEIDGSVINAFRTGTVPNASVTLTADSGVRRAVTTGPDGRFNFVNVPAGPFSLQAIDPAFNVSGNADGVLIDNVARLEVNIALEALAQITVQVWRGDTNSPGTNTTVTLAGGNVLLSVDTDVAGRAQFPNTLPLGSYTMTAVSTGFDDHNGTNIINGLVLISPGTNADAQVFLPGVGRVRGKVLASDGATPVANVSVFLSMSDAPFQGIEVAALSSSDGSFDFQNIAVGHYVLRAQSASLSAQANGSIGSGGEVDDINLVLIPSGSVTGRLLRADGVTTVRNEDVSLAFTPNGSSLGRASVTTDSSGHFVFNGVPLGNVHLTATVEKFNGVRNVLGVLNTDGQVLDLGDVILDEALPAVVSVTPSSGVTEISTATAIDILFSEPIDPQSINRGGIFLRSVSGATVPATITLIAATDGQLRVVHLVPVSRLQSNTTYQLVVIENDRPAVLDLPAMSGPTDLEARFLAAPFTSLFTTADNDPPRLVSISPSNNQQEVELSQVIRLSFNEPIQSVGFSFVVTGPQGNVAGVANVGLGGLALVFTPAGQLSANSTYQFSVSNVFDLAGNRASGEPFTGTFATLDTIGPTIGSLSIADGKAPVAGGTVPIQATLVGSEPGARVRFTADLSPLGSAIAPPFRVNATLPLSGSTTIRAIATDQFGNDGPFAEVILNVVSNQPPTVSFVRGSPSSGPLTKGQAFSLVVSATDDLAVSNIVVTSAGALPFTTNFIGGAQRTLNFTVPSTAILNNLLEFRAHASDVLGLESTDTVIDLAVLDSAPPTVEILSPAGNALLSPTQPLNLVITSSDNNTNHQLAVVLSGGINATQTLAVAAAPGVTVTNTFIFALTGAPDTGANVTATIRAIDTAGNTSEFVRTFRLPDTRPPQFVSANPTNGAVAQSLWLTGLAYDFDEPLDPASVNTNAVVVTNNAAATTPFAVSLANANQRVLVSLARPLLPGVVYTNVLLPTFTDTSSNAWQNIGGAAVPSQGVPFTFTTAAILASAPTNATRVVAGQSVLVTANYEAGLGASFVRFQLNDNAPVQVAAGPTNASVTLSLAATDVAGLISITASPDASFTEPLAFPSIVLDVRSQTEDSDGDGMPNGYEIAHGLDPFRNDANEDTDHDGVPNLQEFLLGSDPQNADTDGDGIPDGVDPRPLAKNLPPAVVSDDTLTIQSPQDLGVTISASDPDGDPLVVRISRLPQMGRLFQTADGTTRGALITETNTPITNSQFKLIFSPPFATNTIVEFSFIADDGFAQSAEGTNQVAVTHIPGADSDGDGMTDEYEVANGLDPEVNDAAGDKDGDGLTNLFEFTHGLLANNADTDGDFLSDSAEFTAGTDPLNPDTDGDGIVDGRDPNPLRNDSDIDGDGIADQDDPDMDNDGLSNDAEIALGTDPRKFDTDGDGWPDGLEVELGSDPLDANSRPILFITAEPQVGLILPATPALALDDSALTLSEPTVKLVLPAEPPQGPDSNAVTLSEPTVQLILPTAPDTGIGVAGVTVSEPPILLVLPASPPLDQAALGVTLSEPTVALILPAAPDTSSGDTGITLSEPVVLLQFESQSGIVAPMILQRIEISGATDRKAKFSAIAAAPRQVTLDWMGPDSGNFVIQSSSDLIRWSDEPAEISHLAPRQFRAQCTLPADNSRFYRVIQLP